VTRGRADPYRGRGVVGIAAEGRRRRGRAAGRRRRSWRSRGRVPPGLWASRVEAWGSCDGFRGVRMARGTPAVRNLHGGRDSPETGPGGISARAGSDVGDGGHGEVSGAQARLPRRLGLAVGRRSSTSTAAQGLCAARLSERGGARVGRRWSRWEEGTGLLFVGQLVALACAPE
jgi:hypothetical protein